MHPGDSIGLIGRNGAGKTTLLRMISGLVKPDRGRIAVRGRVQALIALGAGFNPVLTGRENIYVNAAILGLSKNNIKRKFDEIVEFSGIESFIDAPVQSYSSGMVVRLGFSVAVHMEPDILLIDEVLAVGDIPFRAKCHKKLGELKEKGIPWILVAHDMGTIRNQTNQVIYLENGCNRYQGNPEEAIANYLYSASMQEIEQNVDDLKIRREKRNWEGMIQKTILLDKNYTELQEFRTGDTLIIQINYLVDKTVELPSFGVHIYSSEGLCYSSSSTSASGVDIEFIRGNGSIYFVIDQLPLISGIYRVRVDIWDRNMVMLDKVNEAAYINVRGGYFSNGLIYMPHKWVSK